MDYLLTKVYWSLGGTRYAAYDDFVDAVTRHNDGIDPENGWKPGQIVSDTPIRVVYEAMWKDEDDTIDLNIGEPGVPLTMGLALFTLNNATVDFFKDADARYFEGLYPVKDKTYLLRVGS